MDPQFPKGHVRLVKAMKEARRHPPVHSVDQTDLAGWVQGKKSTDELRKVVEAAKAAVRASDLDALELELARIVATIVD